MAGYVQNSSNEVTELRASRDRLKILLCKRSKAGKVTGPDGTRELKRQIDILEQKLVAAGGKVKKRTYVV